MLLDNSCTLCLDLDFSVLCTGFFGGNCSLNKSFYCFQAGLEWNRLLWGRRCCFWSEAGGGGVRRAQQYSMDSGQTGGWELYRICTTAVQMGTWVFFCTSWSSGAIRSPYRQVPHIRNFTWGYNIFWTKMRCIPARKACGTNSVPDIQWMYFDTLLKTTVHHVAIHVTGEGNSEDAVIILQQQQGEGWAEVWKPFQWRLCSWLCFPGGPNGDNTKSPKERAAKGNEPDCPMSHLQWAGCCASGISYLERVVC